MAFRETCAMEERIQMLSDYDTGAFSVTELSERYGVSRETFYLWRERRLNGDAMWFQDRSHAPRSIPGRTEATMIERIVALRHRFPHFGPKSFAFACSWTRRNWIGRRFRRSATFWRAPAWSRRFGGNVDRSLRARRRRRFFR